MAAGKINRSSAGRIMRTAEGKIRKCGCCGPGVPCGLVVGEGCGCQGGSLCHADTVERQLRRWVNGVEELVYYGPQNCCCSMSNLSGTTAEIYSLETYIDSLDRPWSIEFTGSGSGPSFVITRTIDGPFGPTVTNPTYFMTCFPRIAALGGGTVQGFTGFYRVDCETAEQEWTGTGGKGAPGKPTTFVGLSRNDPNTGSCWVTGGCQRGACCCEGDCYANVSPAECSDMGGDYQGHNVKCADVDCEALDFDSLLATPGIALAAPARKVISIATGRETLEFGSGGGRASRARAKARRAANCADCESDRRRPVR